MTAPTMAELRRRRDEIIEIARERGATRVRVFGSVARGDANTSSDVDFLVDLADGRSLFDLGGLLMDLRDALGTEVEWPPRHRFAPEWPNACSPTPSTSDRMRGDRDRLLDMIEIARSLEPTEEE